MAKKWSSVGFRQLGLFATFLSIFIFTAADLYVISTCIVTGRAVALMWYTKEQEVYLGGIPESHGEHMQSAPGVLALARKVLLLEYLGFLHSRGPKFPLLQQESDPEARFCRQVIDYQWLHPTQGGGNFPQVRASKDSVEEFVRYCKKEWHSLSPEEQQLLASFRAAGDIPQDVLVRPPGDTEAIGAAARAAMEDYSDGHVLSAGELAALINSSVLSSTWNAAGEGGAFQAHQPLNEMDVQAASQTMLQYYESMHMRGLPQIPSSWKAVGDTIRAGKMAIFDARPLLPQRLFNISFKAMADFEGREEATKIPVLSNGCFPTSLANFAEMHEDFQQRGTKSHFNLADSRSVLWEEFSNPTLGDKLDQVSQAAEGKSHHENRCRVAYVNNRRLPKFYASLPNLSSELGMEDEILRDEGYLWMGPVRGGFHYDEEANIYVQLAGESDVFLVPQSHVDAFTYGARFRNLPNHEELLRDPFMRKIPFHLLRLKPGDALTFPGFTFHLFLAQSFNRLAVNFFFLPKWRKMEYTKYDWYSSERRVPGGDERLALRQLWARTFVRLYEETGTGVIFMGEKNEYI